MPQKYSEDFFEHTKMTFGEHLDELRRALWKSVLSLVIGFLVGLLFAPQVVEAIKAPLEASLKAYYQGQDVQKLASILAARDGRDRVTEADLEAAEAIIIGGGLIFEKRYVDPAELQRLFFQMLRQLHPDWVSGIEWPQVTKQANPGKEDLFELLLYSEIDDDLRVRVISLGVQEPFVVYVKAALMLGAVISSPLVFYFIWQFVAAGLYPHEKSYVYVFGPFSLLLFLAGAALAYFAVIGLVLDFLFTFNAHMGIDPDPRISEWLSFVLLLPIGFGLSFQLPLVMLFLERIGVMSVGAYIDKWRIAVLVISVLSMLLTPADPGSMILMFVPLTILYFGGIALCRFWPKRKTPFGEPIENA